MNLDFKIAQSWNQLNFYQLGEILFLLKNAKKNDSDLHENLLSILFVDENVNDGTHSAIRKADNYFYLLSQTTPEVVEKEFNPLSFLFESNTLSKFPPVIEIDGKTFYGPADRLINLTIEEFSYVDHFYYSWFTTKKNIDLDRLITTLYRPKSITDNANDVREAFSIVKLKERSSIIPKLDEKTKLIIGHAYDGARSSIINRYPTVFPKSKFKKSKPKIVKYKSFKPMINSMVLSEKQPLGNLHQVKNSNILDFFDIVQESIILNRKREQEAKKK